MTLYPKRSSAIWLLVACTAFVATGVWMGRSGNSIGWICAAFFGLGIPVAVIQLIPGSTFLHVDSNGITYSNLFRKTSLSWSIFQEFFVVTMRQSGLKVHEMVGFNYVSTYDRSRAARALATAISGCEGALPDTYGMKAEELAKLLNARLHEAGAQAPAPDR
jgi:hypothetical protein